MKYNKYKIFSFLSGGILLAALVLFGARFIFSMGDAREENTKEVQNPPSSPQVITVNRPKYVRGIHLTSWVTGSSKFRNQLHQLLDTTELNTVVIDVKEYEGEVYIPGVRQAEAFKIYVPAIPDLERYLATLKSKGIYSIARIVVFKDNQLPRKKPEWAVKTSTGGVWKDYSGNTWVDPYRKDVWDYNLDVAERAIDLGFEEIQFDYIRFPSDGNVKTCRYSQPHSSTASAAALVGFLQEANRRLKARGANISIDVFGLTTTASHDMGIGQKIVEMSQWVDFVSPMVYPSHYAKGEYRIPDPNKAPYKTVYLGLEGAKRRMGASATKLRPFLQDFSLGHRYGPEEVRAQIQASYDNDIGDWLLWNPRCVYTRGALKGKEFANAYEKKSPPAEMLAREPATLVKDGKKTSGTKPTPAASREITDTSLKTVEISSPTAPASASPKETTQPQEVPTDPSK